MRAKTVYEFVRGKDPKESLGLGRVGTIKKFFGDLGITDDKYEITETEVIFRGSLDLEEIPITELPEGLNIGGYLDLRGTHITKLPKELKVREFLVLIRTHITELPEGLSIGGTLFLNGTNITKLPEGLNVGENLYLNGTPITELPEDLIVEGSICVLPNQKQLINFIQRNKFAHKLRVMQ